MECVRVYSILFHILLSLTPPGTSCSPHFTPGENLLPGDFLINLYPWKLKDFVLLNNLIREKSSDTFRTQGIDNQLEMHLGRKTWCCLSGHLSASPSSQSSLVAIVSNILGWLSKSMVSITVWKGIMWYSALFVLESPGKFYINEDPLSKFLDDMKLIVWEGWMAVNCNPKQKDHWPLNSTSNMDKMNHTENPGSHHINGKPGEIQSPKLLSFIEIKNLEW